MRRYAPDRPLPPYAFVPGRSPHPRRPGGHAHGQPPPPEELLDPGAWGRCEAYRLGVDLFNHGYYWEAHEAWEGPWRASGGAGPVTALLQGLIRLAAAGVKVRQGDPGSVRSHAVAAGRLFAVARHGAGAATFCGLDLAGLEQLAGRIAEGTAVDEGDDGATVRILFPGALALEEGP